MTRLQAISQNSLALTCRLCNHTGIVPVADLLKRLPEGTTVQEVVDNARCGLCRAKAKSDFRILYVGASMDAMIGGRQDNPSQK